MKIPNIFDSGLLSVGSVMIADYVYSNLNERGIPVKKRDVKYIVHFLFEEIGLSIKEKELFKLFQFISYEIKKKPPCNIYNMFGKPVLRKEVISIRSKLGFKFKKWFKLQIDPSTIVDE